ncbi:MAG: aminoacetone oxidase family FAD-binding enzyme [Candidatus Azambacteria bacterium]|nr:aminoacetone oxidase family FAD-binding enzyme [Candidatus Azambacteria bacterium]
MIKEDKFEVVVIGGGPAGMMAAGRAAEFGHSVLLLEKNSKLGKKLLMTGGGRCNFTNNKQNIRAIAEQYKGSGQFLMSAFSQFDVAKTIDFFNCRGMKTKEEAEGRIFPSSDKSQSVLDVLIKYMDKGGVEVKTNAVVTGISLDENKKYITVQLKGGRAFIVRSCIVATGGISHPETGSTGEGFAWLKKMGHTIIKNNFALVPIAVKDEWVKKIAGVTLSDIKLAILQNGKKQSVQKGRILFTHFGISGPTVLNMSKDVGELLPLGEVIIMLDLFPKLDHGALKQNFKEILINRSNKKLKNVLAILIPSALVSVVLKITGIDGETANHSVRHEDRMKLVKCMKEIPLHIEGLLGADKAIVSSGGVALEEINFKTMQSRIAPQIYIIGDALNVNRSSGGYSLQLCWTTGFVAGSNV